MPSVEHNKAMWGRDYRWARQGDEWSEPWGGVDSHWYGSILPRIHAFLPTGRVLEVAPGFGRWTQYLKDMCDHLTVVDLNANCIEACQERFADSPNIAYHVNDGSSLEMIADDSVDFFYTYDSLVHAEMEVIERYLEQLARKLTADGVGFLHHSNIGHHSEYHRYQRRLPEPFRQFLLRQGVLNRRHFRSFSVTAEKVAAACEKVGLCCRSQELVNWRQRMLIDAFTVFCRKGSKWARPNRVLRNPSFMIEAGLCAQGAPLYGVS
ncbi:MAG: class I SAM-dependent methyltransferase [bacterium]